MADNVDIQLLGKQVGDLMVEVRVLDRAVQRMDATLASHRHEMLTGFDRIEASNGRVIALLEQLVPKG